MKGLDTVAADALLRISLCVLPTKNDPTTFKYLFVMGYILAERYRMDDTDQEMMPLSYQIL